MPTPLPAISPPDYGKTLDAFRTGKQDFLEQQKRDLLKEAGGLAAAGNLTGAKNKLYSGGNFGEAYNVGGEMRAQSAEQRAIQSHARSLDDAKLAKAAKSQELLGNMASKIKTPEQLELAKAILKGRGLDASSVTFDQLPMLIQQGITTQQAYQNELEERRMLNQEAERIRLQANTDRSFAREALESDRTHAAGRDDAAFNRMHQTRVYDANREESRYTPIPNKARLFDRRENRYLEQQPSGPDSETRLELGKYEQALRKEWTQLTSESKAINDSLNRMRTASKSASGASDIAMIYSYMKMLDPTSVVREGEYATAAQTGGLPQQVVALYNKALTGQFLTPDQRKEFLQSAEALAKDKGARSAKARSQFENIAKSSGADPSRVMLDEGDAVTPLPSGGPVAPPTSGAAPRPGQIDGGYRFKGGDPADRNNWEKVN